MPHSVLVGATLCTLEMTPRDAALLVQRLREHPITLAARRSERAIRRTFLFAAHEAQDAVPMTALVDALSLGHPGTGAPLHALEPALAALVDALNGASHTVHHTPYARFLAAKKHLKDVLAEAVKRGAKAAPLNLEFDAANPAAIAWAERRAAELVVEIDVAQREAIRTVVVKGFDEGISPYETARLIRSAIGLTERDAAAVAKRGLEQGLERAERYAGKLLRQRAQTIAVNEALTASNEGQRQLWQQAREKGLLTGAERKTIIQSDPCPICEQVTGEIVGLDEAFSLGLPPFHVRCRCVEGII